MKLHIQLEGTTEIAEKYLNGADMVIEGPTKQECIQHWANMAAKFANEGIMLPKLDDNDEPVEDELFWLPGHAIKCAVITASVIETPNSGIVLPNAPQK